MSVPHRIPARHARPRSSWVPALLAVAALAAGFAFAGVALTSTPGLAATLTVNQCNDLNGGPLGATTEIRCTVTIVNTVDGDTTSSTTTVTRQCSLEPCTGGGNGTFTSTSADLVTDVAQCNASGNDAGVPVVCSVDITNSITEGTPGAAPLSAATVNQCVGSGTGGGGSMVCSPVETTIGADVVQCNGSGDGGGTAIDCRVENGSSVSPLVPIRVDQCNGSARNGGNVLTCSTVIRTSIVAASVPGPTPTPTTTATPTPGPSASATPSPSTEPSGSPAPSPTTAPTTAPTNVPTTAPTTAPTVGPTQEPTTAPAPVPAPVQAAEPHAGSPAGSSTGASVPATTTGTTTFGDSSVTTSSTGTPQITRVPSGGVEAGGGPTAPQGSAALLGTGGLLLLAAAANASSRRSVRDARHLRIDG
jgi:hypothetical protein